jgi:hypothetical protein
MPNDESSAVPALVNLTQSDAEAALKTAALLVGNVTRANSPTVPAGAVSSSNPPAQTSVPKGSSVDLEFSSGPTQVPVPNVIGFSQQAAESTLRSAGLVVGQVTKTPSNTVASSGVSDTNPPAGTLVDPKSKVDMEVSTGRAYAWTPYVLPGLFTGLALSVLVLIYFIVLQPGQVFLLGLASKEVARGLITFLIAISTVGIAIILSISTIVLSEGDEGDKRFDRGKQILSILIGVLGTIVGFYFGSDIKSTQPLAIITTKLPDGVVNEDYGPITLQTTGARTPPLKWTVDPAPPADVKLDPDTGTISGKPKAVSSRMTYTFTVKDSATPAATADIKVPLEIRQGQQPSAGTAPK